MKKAIFSLIVILLFAATSSSVIAQPPASPDRSKMQEMMKQRLKDSVGLSDVMVDSVMNIRAEYQPQMRDAFMNQQLTPDEKTAKLNDIKNLLKDRYKKVGLTDEQVAKIEAMDQQMRDRMKNRMNGGGAAPNN